MKWLFCILALDYNNVGEVSKQNVFKLSVKLLYKIYIFSKLLK